MSTLIFCSLIFIIAGAAVTAQSPPKPGEVYLFMSPHYRGEAQLLQLADGMCTNFNAKWNDKLRSIDLEKSTCAIAYEDANCVGKAIRLNKGGLGTSDLSDIRWADKISSMTLC